MQFNVLSRFGRGTLSVLALSAMTGCATVSGLFESKDPAPAPVPTVEPGVATPDTSPEPVIDPDGQTPEALDTTTAAEQAEAAAPPTTTEPRAGATVASLGDPAKPGFWLETPLVSKEQPGRVSYKDRWAKVTLIPIDGPATAGSRASLATFRLLDAPLAELIEIEVFPEG